VIIPNTLTDRMPKVPEGCLGGFWHCLTLEGVMNSIRNGLGMRET